MTLSAGLTREWQLLPVLPRRGQQARLHWRPEHHEGFVQNTVDLQKNQLQKDAEEAK